MTSIRARTVRRGLTSKGFDEVNRGDVFFHFIVNGKKSGIHTMMSHGETYCGTKYLTTMARQLGLKRDAARAARRVSALSRRVPEAAPRARQALATRGEGEHMDLRERVTTNPAAVPRPGLHQRHADPGCGRPRQPCDWHFRRGDPRRVPRPPAGRRQSRHRLRGRPRPRTTAAASRICVTRFKLDENLPARNADALRKAGHDHRIRVWQLER